MESDSPKPFYFTGLDVGQAGEFTALSVLERERSRESPATNAMRHTVVHLERFAPGTPYTAVCSRVTDLFVAPPLARSMLIVDQTGVGRPIIDLLARSGVNACIIPLTITAGHQTAGDGAGGSLVPKKELVSVLQILLQARRLKVPSSLPESPALVRELSAFRARVAPATDDTRADWRERPHDDLVLAVTVAAWMAERWVEPYAGPLFLWPPVPAESADSPKQALLEQVIAEMDREEDDVGGWWR
jgi:hypothetical protein